VAKAGAYRHRLAKTLLGGSVASRRHRGISAARIGARHHLGAYRRKRRRSRKRGASAGGWQRGSGSLGARRLPSAWQAASSARRKRRSMAARQRGGGVGARRLGGARLGIIIGAQSRSSAAASASRENIARRNIIGSAHRRLASRQPHRGISIGSIGSAARRRRSARRSYHHRVSGVAALVASCSAWRGGVSGSARRNGARRGNIIGSASARRRKQINVGSK